MNDNPNPLVPRLGTIVEVIKETSSGLIQTFRVEPAAGSSTGDSERQWFDYMPGQCGMVSKIGVGESMIAMASTPTRPGPLEFTIKLAGRNTAALHDLGPGDQVGVRGPYGNGYPVERLKGRDLLVIGGGIGLSGLRSLVNFCLDRRSEFGRMAVVYGAQNPGEMCYKDELLSVWPAAPRTAVHLTVDAPAPGWDGSVALVPAYLQSLAPAPGQIAIVCGPPLMIRYTVETLNKLGFSPEDILVSMELKMQCGIGRCGRCNIGSKYVCRDGPVFTMAELGRLPEEY